MSGSRGPKGRGQDTEKTEHANPAESKRKHLLKAKGIKIRKSDAGAADAATPSKAEQAEIKMPKGKKVAESRRPKKA